VNGLVWPVSVDTLEAMNVIGGLAGILIIALYFGVLGFLISLLWRITIAREDGPAST